MLAFTFMLGLSALPPVVVQVPESARFSMRVLEDGYSILLGVNTGAPTVSAPAPWQTTVLQITPTQSRIELRYPAHLIDASVRRQKGTLTLQAEANDFAASFRRLMEEPSPELGAAGPLAADLRRAEGLMLSDPNAATEQFIDLTDVFVLAPWAKLRMADIAMLQNDTPRACEGWATVIREFVDRTVSFVAATRRAAAQCPVAQPKTLPPAWSDIIRPVTADDVTGRFLRNQAEWSLQWIHDLNGLRDVLAVGLEALGMGLYRALVARAVRSGDTLEVMRWLRDTDAGQLRGSPMDVFVDAALVHCALELPGARNKEKDPALKAAKLCRLLPAVPLPSSPDVPAVLEQLKNFSLRMDAVRAAMRAER